ncbi:Diaminopimelate epimerase-like protein [Roridomyces roridus]|uniref:Diaminopimelate epimerase-like protein n=1 Tax=Roridomyces roridus TaxID=1738132 RepID=A0AAD7FMR5_9AGAR|nr:Diaminopimelate epimerase-like protein [Roridomyces roridus]
MTTQLKYSVIDAFTSKPFGGNPAAVIVLEQDHGLDDETLQLIGREFSLSETAFLVPLADHTVDAPHFSIRWFTPGLEAPLCGHATIAAAYHLQIYHPQLRAPYRFESRVSGQLRVDYDKEKDYYVMDFPAEMPVAFSSSEQADVLKKAYTWFPSLSADKGEVKAVLRTKRGYFVEVDESVDVANVVHDTIAINRDTVVGQCVITAPHTPTPSDPSQVHSRMFAAGSGIDEDPVTGSAHTRIVPYWLERLGGNTLQCAQVSKRGGELDCEWLRDEGRVLLKGRAVRMAEGVLFV